MRSEPGKRLVAGRMREGTFKMRIWRGRGCRAALASTRRAAGISLIALVVLPVPARAGTGEDTVGDPRDIGARLDLKAVTHVVDGSSIVYTAETYAGFTDRAAAFKWGIDRDNDEAFDLFAFTEWRDGKLVAGVKDASGRQVASGAVTRPAPSVIKLAIPADVLGGVAVYRYAVDAGAPGQRDLAPNAGLIKHRLGAITVASSREVRTADSAPSTPAAAPAALPAAAAAKSSAPAPAPPAANLPRTGPGDRALVPLAGTVLMLGGGLVALGAQRNRVRRRGATGGIR